MNGAWKSCLFLLGILVITGWQDKLSAGEKFSNIAPAQSLTKDWRPFVKLGPASTSEFIKTPLSATTRFRTKGFSSRS